MAYWLIKSEPFKYSWDQFNKDKRTFWDGVRNYQARNMLRDDVKLGDKVFIYHSSCKLIGVAGIARVVREAYADPSQFQQLSPYYDAKSPKEQPRWVAVDLVFERKLPAIISLDKLKSSAKLSELPVVQKGSRLSVMPVNEAQWQTIMQLV